jgi:5-methylcytosine-specific restriction endonuclease McrA
MAERRGSVEVQANGRVLALSAAWFSDGARRRTEARRSRRCVECGAALPSARTPYCSRRCRWRFHGHYFWDSARTYVMARDRYTCQICHRRAKARSLDVDHILEISRGGASLEYSNLQTVCRECHRQKTVQFLRLRAALRDEPGASPPAGRQPRPGASAPSPPTALARA